MDARDGVLLLDKPAGISSAGMLNRVKRSLPRGTKIGHAGTLDPFATGLLIAMVGKATKKCELMMGQPKTYVTTVKLGARSPTLDPESAEEAVEGPIPDRAAVEIAVATFAGEIMQVPPIFSAMKVNGRRAYDLARKGQEVELAPRKVVVYRMSVTRYEYPFADLDMEVGRGFYVRSLARDLGVALGSAGYLTALRRTRIGEYDVGSAAGLEAISPDTIWGLVGPV